MNPAELSGESYSTYFETLPDDVCVKLLEWLDQDVLWGGSSENELYPDIPSLTDSGKGFLLFLFSEDGPFYNAVSSVLTTVTFCLLPYSTGISVALGRVTIGPEIILDEELGRRLVERILRVCGESTKEISVELYDDSPLIGEDDEHQFIREFVSLVIEHCPAVDRLTITSSNYSVSEAIVFLLVTKYSSRLRSFEWCLSTAVDNLCIIPLLTCTQIRHLRLPATPQLMWLLEHTGPLLESLSLTFDTLEGCVEVIEAIERNCKKLERILLDDTGSIINRIGEERYVAFLCSYGNQLIAADIDAMMEPEYLQQVCSKCSNLYVKYQIVGHLGKGEWEHVRVFGPRIEHLKVDINLCTGDESWNAISSCTNLSGLTFLNFAGMPLEQDLVDTAVMSTLSCLSTPSLEDLFVCRFRATIENLAMIAAATSNLKSIVLQLAEPVGSGAIFKTIADSNPHLCEVHILEDLIEDGERDGDSTVDLLRVLVNTFSKCRSLTFHLLNTGDDEVRKETILDVCASLPCRGIDLLVQIGSSSHLQTRRLRGTFPQRIG